MIFSILNVIVPHDELDLKRNLYCFISNDMEYPYRTHFSTIYVGFTIVNLAKHQISVTRKLI